MQKCENVNTLGPDITPVQIEIWEPDPENPDCLRYAGNRLITDVYLDLCKRLKKNDTFPEEFFQIGYAFSRNPSPFPKFVTLACYAVTGPLDGHYVYVDALDQEGGRQALFIGKTLQGMDFAYKVACACAKHLGA